MSETIFTVSGHVAPVRVLLIEDNAGFSYFVRNVLTREHTSQFDFKHCGTLADGLTALSAESFDVVLLDLGLPDSAGLATFKRVQALSPVTPVIILTVLDDDELTMTAMRMGAQDYLLKGRLDAELLTRSIRYAKERAGVDASLREVSGRLLCLQDDERRAVARALHEGVAQNLAALSMNLSMLQNMRETFSPRAWRLLDDAGFLAEQCAAELRTTSYLLHPPLLDDVGLAGAVREYADGFAQRSGILVDLELPHSLGRLSRDVETALFRILQECLVNIHRHAESPTASIRIVQSDTDICLEVIDKGKGMSAHRAASVPPSKAGVGVGVAGMQERCRQLGGRLDIETGPGGTAFRAILPTPPRAP